MHQQSLETTTAAPPLRLSRQPDMELPRISVIIPTLNEEKLLERTLTAFTPELRECYALELIVSDGGSTDRTLVIAEQYADVIVRHTDTKRQTIAEGRNAGAAVARGDVLIFLNGDTVPANPTRFLEIVSRVMNNVQSSESPHIPNYLALACPVEIAPHERRLSDVLFHSFFNTYVRLLNTLGMGIGRGECQIVRAEAFRAVGGYNSAIAAGEDFDLYQRLRARGQIGWHKETLVHESPRRFRRFGYTRILWLWAVNAVSVIVRHKAVSEEWEAIR